MHNLQLAHGLHCCAESPASVTHELCSTMVFTFFLKFIFKNYFLTLWVFVAVWSLCLVMYGQPGLLFVALCRLLIPVAFLVVEHRLYACMFSSCSLQAVELGLCSCGSWAYLVPRGMWDPPGPGNEPMCPALAGWFLTTGPPGKLPIFTIER